MIELKNISARTVVPYDAYSIKELVKKTGAVSAEDVLELITKYPEYNWAKVIKMFGEVERKMDLANKRGHEPEMFYTKGYSTEDLSQQDLVNGGGILLLNNPTDFKVKYRTLETKSIAEIKTDLAHTLPNGQNVVSGSNSLYRNIGEDSIPRLVSSIEMYEDQIQRQSKLTKERNINLFELHKDTKMDITEEMYNEIIMYLVYNTNERLVWSTLSDAQKQLYLSSAINKKQEDIKTRQRIKEYIANYTTLPELERVADHDLKVLKRFIVK